MGTFTRLLGLPQPEGYDTPEHRSTLAAPGPVLVDALTGGRATDSGERVGQKDALGVAAVFSAVAKISEAVGSLPLKVYRVEDSDDRMEARTHRSWRMLHDKPNPATIAHTFWSTVSAQLLLEGNAFIKKVRTDPFGEVDELYLMDGITEVELLPSGEKKFWQGNNGGRRRSFSAEEVLHIVGYSLDGLVGVSRIQYCRQTLGIALARDRFEASFYKQGARTSGVIEYPGRLGPNGAKNLADTFRGLHGGARNAHKVPVLEEGAHFNQVQMSLEDMQFIQGAQLSRSEVAMIFDLPAAYLNASTGDSLTYATTESNQIQFATMAVSPLTNRIARALSTDPEILPWNVMYCDFVLEGLMRADMKTRAEYWTALKALNVVDEAYIASRENLPPPPPKPKAPSIPPANAVAQPPGNGAGNLVPADLSMMMNGGS
jgi:HK97 family phage portal protein